MAEYLDIDPTIVRILWIIAGLFSGGLMILGYIILAFVIPEAPYPGVAGPGWTAPAAPAGQGWGAPAAPAGQAPAAGYQAPAAGYSYPPAQPAPAWNPDWAAQAAAERRSRGRGPGAAVVVGTVLIVFGGIALANSMMPAWVGAAVVGPALVIALGAAFLVASARRRDEPIAPTAPAATGAAYGTAAADAQTFDAAMAAPATGTGYDADATSPVDLGAAEPTDLQPGTETK